MLDIEFIPKILKKMVEFLTPLVPHDLVKNYHFILEIDPLDQKCAIQRELKPYEFDLDGFIEKLFSDHNLKIMDYKKEDIIKFRRFLQALCEAS